MVEDLDDNEESPDFFYDNQYVIDDDKKDHEGNYPIYCLGRSIYKLTYSKDIGEFEVVRHGYGYLQKGRRVLEVKELISSGLDYPGT